MLNIKNKNKMVVYLVGGICMGIMLRPYVDELIKNYVKQKINGKKN